MSNATQWIALQLLIRQISSLGDASAIVRSIADVPPSPMEENRANSGWHTDSSLCSDSSAARAYRSICLSPLVGLSLLVNIYIFIVDNRYTFVSPFSLMMLRQAVVEVFS